MNWTKHHSTWQCEAGEFLLDVKVYEDGHASWSVSGSGCNPYECSPLASSDDFCPDADSAKTAVRRETRRILEEALAAL